MNIIRESILTDEGGEQLIWYSKATVWLIMMGLLCLGSQFSTSIISETVSSVLVHSDLEPVAPKIAIIIDDFGGKVKGVESFFQSKLPITVAVMPFMEKTKEQAEEAHRLGLEVIVHLPLEPKRGKKSWLGPNAITSDLSIEEVKERTKKALEDVPHAVGLNNHMGSKIVEDREKMRAILEVVKEKNLFIIDSGTSSKSQIPSLAEEMGISYGVRDVFIDDTRSPTSHVIRQVKKLLKIAKKKGTAIGIGHVGTHGNQTVQGILRSVELVKEMQVEIVPVSHIIRPTELPEVTSMRVEGN